MSVFYPFRICTHFSYHQNVPFKHIKMQNISYDVTVTYEGQFVEEPKIDDQRLKFESKTSSSMNISEHRAIIKFCMHAKHLRWIQKCY